MSKRGQLSKFPGVASLKSLVGGFRGLVRGRLWLQVMVGLVLGIIVGILLGPDLKLVSSERAEAIGLWLAFPGRAFLALIQMIVIPLILSSIVLAISANESLAKVKRLGAALIVYVLATTTIAVSIGLSLALLIRPGSYVKAVALSDEGGDVAPELLSEGFSGGSIPERIVSLIPTNPIVAMANFEMLQIVIFSFILGAALLSIAPKKAQVLVEFLSAIQGICMMVVQFVLRIAPLAVFGLILQAVLQSGAQTLLGLAVYVGTVMLGLLLLVGVYIIILIVFVGKSPFWFLKKVFPLQLLAFSTSSSAAVMPVSIKTAEEDLELRPEIPLFVVPLGSTINMDGTALYQGVATVFLAQVYGVELSLPTLILLVMTAVGASIGTPSTPGVGIVILATILTSANIPPEGVGLILGVDRILDMSRTAVNVTGDQMACLVLDKLSRRWKWQSSPSSPDEPV